MSIEEESMLRRRTLLVPALALVLALTLGVGRASADVTLTLSNGNPGIAPPVSTGPWGTVLIHLESPTLADFTFTANSGFSFGGQGATGVNVNATSFTVGSLSANWVSPNVTSGNEDGFGNFNVSIDNFDGIGQSQTTLSFKVTNNSGTWANESAVLTANGSGFLAAAHVFVTSGPNQGSTGFAANGPSAPPPVPEPSAMLIAALGAIGFGGYSLRRRRQC
jgi:hypothetical protein